MRYQVAGYTIKPLGNPVQQSIDEARYNSIKQSKNVCLLTLGFEERFQLVLDNFHDWETELLNQAHRHLLWKSREHGDAMQERLSLDRHLVNLLTSLRLYLDHSDHGISAIFSNPSAELKSIKEFKNVLYNENLGYRLLEALRNHVQHCGLPVHVISYNQALIDKKTEGAYIQISIAPKLNVDELAANGGFKKAVLEEIRALGKQIDIRPFARDYISCLVLLHDQIRKIIAGAAEKSKEIYVAAITEFSTIEGHAVQYPKLQYCDDQGLVAESLELPAEFLNYHAELYSQNSKVSDIRKLFASSLAASK